MGTEGGASRMTPSYNAAMRGHAIPPCRHANKALAAAMILAVITLF